MIAQHLIYLQHCKFSAELVNFVFSCRNYQGPEALALQERCERLQVEVGDAYRSSAQASQQLVHKTNSLQSLKEEYEDRGKRIETLEDQLDAARCCSL